MANTPYAQMLPRQMKFCVPTMDDEDTDMLLDEKTDDGSAWTLTDWIDYFENEDTEYVPSEPPRCSADVMYKFLYEQDLEGDMVYVFKRQLDDEDDVRNPMEKVRKIFPKKIAYERLDTTDQGFPELLNKPIVPAKLYHTVVRQKFVECLSSTGVKLDSRENEELDQVLLKAWLPPEGKAVKSLAHRFFMLVPLKGEEYKLPNENNEKVVPTFVEYKDAYSEKIEPFSKIQCIRLMRRRIGELVSIPQMSSQAVLHSSFIKGSYIETKRTSDAVCDWKRLFCPPNDKEVDAIRSYFGEKVALYYLWMGIVIRGLFHLLPIAVVVTVAFWMLHLFPSVAIMQVLRFSQLAFVVAGLISIMLLAFTFRRESARKAQLWGMKNRNALYWGEKGSLRLARGGERGTPLSTRTKTLRRSAHLLVTVGYFGFSIGIITWSLIVFDTDVREKYAYCFPAALLVVILREIWSHIAIVLTDKEDYAVNTYWEDSFSTKLFLIYIPLTLYPGIYIAFIKKLVERWCGSPGETFSEMAARAVGHYGTLTPALEKTFRHLDASDLIYGIDGVCLSGCYPTSCLNNDCSNDWGMQSNCMNMLNSYILSYLLVHFFDQAIKIAWVMIFQHNAAAQKLKTLVSDAAHVTEVDIDMHCHVTSTNPSWDDHTSNPLLKANNPGIRFTKVSMKTFPFMLRWHASVACYLPWYCLASF
jgi:hypothetical protein